MRDERTCPICLRLDGYTWVFTVGQDHLTDALFHPELGEVWSLSMGSNAHGHHFQRHNCRCQIEFIIDMEDILAKCVYLREVVASEAESNIIGNEE